MEGINTAQNSVSRICYVKYLQERLSLMDISKALGNPSASRTIGRILVALQIQQLRCLLTR